VLFVKRKTKMKEFPKNLAANCAKHANNLCTKKNFVLKKKKKPARVPDE
jgi:hypothetical protein